MARLAFLCSASGCCMHCSVFTYPLQFMPTWDGANHIFLVRQPAPLLQYGRGSLQDCSQPSFHPTLDRSCICHIITVSLSRREWRDFMEICCSCNSPIQVIRALTGDSQVDRLSQEKSFLQVSNRNCLMKPASTLLDRHRLLSGFRCLSRQSRVYRIC